MNVLVIGGSSGIGKAIAERLAGEACQVATAQRTQPADFPWVPLDLRWPAPRIERAVREAADRLGGLDGLVVSGGVGAFTKPRLRTRGEIQTIEEITRTNDLGARYALLSAFGWMRDHADGSPNGLRAIYIGSSSTHNRSTGIEHYGAAKSAAEKFWMEAGRRYAKYGVRTTIVECGWVEGPMIEDLKTEYREKILRSIPLHRTAAPEEIADVVAYALRAPDYMTGGRIQITGGL